MRAIILAAGRGRRMKGLTDDRPKCLIDVQGKPLLEWQIESLRRLEMPESLMKQFGYAALTTDAKAQIGVRRAVSTANATRLLPARATA